MEKHDHRHNRQKAADLSRLSLTVRGFFTREAAGPAERLSLRQAKIEST
jgi:hypothetical protein